MVLKILYAEATPAHYRLHCPGFLHDRTETRLKINPSGDDGQMLGLDDRSGVT